MVVNVFPSWIQKKWYVVTLWHKIKCSERLEIMQVQKIKRWSLRHNGKLHTGLSPQLGNKVTPGPSDIGKTHVDVVPKAQWKVWKSSRKSSNIGSSLLNFPWWLDGKPNRKYKVMQESSSPCTNIDKICIGPFDINILAKIPSYESSFHVSSISCFHRCPYLIGGTTSDFLNLSSCWWN